MKFHKEPRTETLHCKLTNTLKTLNREYSKHSEDFDSETKIVEKALIEFYRKRAEELVELELDHLTQ